MISSYDAGRLAESRPKQNMAWKVGEISSRQISLGIVVVASVYATLVSMLAYLDNMT